MRDFERVSMGLEAKADIFGSNGGAGTKRKAEEEESEALKKFKAREVVVDGKRKRVFELDEKEMARVAGEERERLKNELKMEKVCLWFRCW